MSFQWASDANSIAALLIDIGEQRRQGRRRRGDYVQRALVAGVSYRQRFWVPWAGRSSCEAAVPCPEDGMDYAMTAGTRHARPGAQGCGFAWGAPIGFAASQAGRAYHFDRAASHDSHSSRGVISQNSVREKHARALALLASTYGRRLC